MKTNVKAFRLSLRKSGISIDGGQGKKWEKRGVNGRRRQVHLKMVRVSNSVILMQREVTCHTDLVATGLTDTTQRVYFNGHVH